MEGGKISRLFLFAIFPFTIANQVYYVPGYYAPLPVYHFQQPIVQYSFHQQHGNRKHEFIPAVSYHGNCGDVTTNWKEEDLSVSANIRIQRPAGRSLEISPWSVDLLWDMPVSQIDVFNGKAYKSGETAFRIMPLSAEQYMLDSQKDEVNFSFKANFSPDMRRPGLQAIVVDGIYHTCNPGPPQKNELSVTKEYKSFSSVSWPKRVLGLYILLADDSEDGFDSAADWNPELYSWQQESSNVLFFTFIHPGTMEVPPSFKKLAATRGSTAPGSIPADTVIMFAIGGYAYSIKPNPWDWLTTREKAEAMAEKVARWPEEYGCDGIDLDLEEGAGAKRDAGPNMIHFIRKLKSLKPDIIISQPVYGYPQVKAETDVINASWDTDGNSQGLADSIGLMVYEGTQALNYVKNYARGSEQWQGFPIKVNAPTNTILLGAKGSSSSTTLVKLANEAVNQDLLGIMVWYSSVKNGFDYAPNWDASTKTDSILGYKKAMNILNADIAKSKVGFSAPVTVVEEEAAAIAVRDLEDANVVEIEN